MDKSKHILSKDHKARGKIIAEDATDFTLTTHLNEQFNLFKELAQSPILLAFYPGGPIHPTCKGQFCDYRDNKQKFEDLGIKVIGISSDPPEKQAKFAEANAYPFLFLHDPGNLVAKQYKCNSNWMLGLKSRGIYIINQKRKVLYFYVEPTILTRKGSEELIKIINDLKDSHFL